MKFNDLSIQEKAAVIRLGIGSGLRSLQQIEDFYNSISEDGDNTSSVLGNRRSSGRDDGNKRNERRMTIRDWLRGNKKDVNNTLNNMMYVDNGGKPYVNGSVASMNRQPWVPSVNIDTSQLDSRPDTYYYDNEGQLHMYPGNYVEPVKRMSQDEIADFFWQMENPNNVGLNQDNGMYYKYRDPNGKDWDVGPGLVIGKTIDDKPYYTKEELDRAAYMYHMDAMDKLAPLYDEKYGYGAFGNIDDRSKLVASDVMYRIGQNGVTPSSWPSMFDAINSGNTAMMLQQSRSKFKDGNNVQNYDNARVKRLGEYLYPGEFEYIFRNSLDPNIRVRKVEQKKNGGYLSSTGPEYPPVIQKVNRSKADFVQRLKDPNRAYIQDWNNPDNIATHKLSWADDGIVYPQVQNVNGRLVDFSRPPYDIWAGYNNAVMNGDTIHMTPQEAEWFTTHYKDYYPGFDEYKKGGSIHIKPENRGKFTALKKRTGHSASWFKKHGTPAQRKMATFALNARKWHHKHPDGGPNDTIQTPNQVIEKYIGTKYDPTRWANKNFLINHNIQENQNAQLVGDYFRSYANSEGAQRILNNQLKWYSSYHPIRDRWYGRIIYGNPENGGKNAINQLSILDNNGVFDLEDDVRISKHRSDHNNVATFIGVYAPNYGEYRYEDDYEYPEGFVLPHELMHRLNDNVLHGAQSEALNQNRNTIINSHDEFNDEKYGDLQGLKFLLYDNGIYDSRGNKDATADDIEKLRQLYPYLRPLQQMDNEKAAWMINHVVDNNNIKNDYINKIAYGGPIKPFSYLPIPEVRY